MRFQMINAVRLGEVHKRKTWPTIVFDRPGQPFWP